MLRRFAIVSVLLMLCSAVTSAQKGGGGPPSPCKNWKAWQNVMPGTASATLHVTATCQFPTAGYSVELVPASGGVQDPPVYELKRVVHKPEGMAAQVITDVPIKYSVETSVEYKTVVIKPDRRRIPIETVH